MRRILLTALALAALGGCSRGDDGGAVIAAEPSAPSTASPPSAEPAPPRARPTPPARPTPGTEAHAAPGSSVAVRTSAPTEAPAIRSIPLAITGMT